MERGHRDLIRRATVEDARALAQLAERTFRDAFAAQNKPEDMDAYIARTYTEELQRGEIQNAAMTTFVVDDGDALIGFAQIKHGEDEVELARIYVDRNHHGRGVANELMNAVIDAAKQAGVAKLWLGVWEHNPRAIRFYEKFGFRVTGSHPFLLGSDLQTDLVMQRTP